MRPPHLPWITNGGTKLQTQLCRVLFYISYSDLPVEQRHRQSPASCKIRERELWWILIESKVMDDRRLLILYCMPKKKFLTMDNEDCIYEYSCQMGKVMPFFHVKRKINRQTNNSIKLLQNKRLTNTKTEQFRTNINPLNILSLISNFMFNLKSTLTNEEWSWRTRDRVGGQVQDERKHGGGNKVECRRQKWRG